MVVQAAGFLTVLMVLDRTRAIAGLNLVMPLVAGLGYATHDPGSWRRGGGAHVARNVSAAVDPGAARGPERTSGGSVNV